MNNDIELKKWSTKMKNNFDAKKIKIGDFVDFRNGVNYFSSGSGYFAKVVGVGNFSSSGELKEYGQIPRIDLSKDLLDEDELRDGDILFVRSNGSKDLVGRSMLIKNPPPRVTFSGFTIRARINSDKIISDYLALLCENDDFKKSMLMAGGGNGNISNINQAMLSAVEINVFSIGYQKEIVSFFNLLKKQIEIIESYLSCQVMNYRSSIFFAMEGVSKNRAKGWVRKRFDEIFLERDECDGNMRLLGVSGESGVIPREEMERRDTSAEDKSSYKVVRIGDIAYNTMRMWQGVCGLSRYDGIVSPAYTVVTPVKGKILGEFAEHLFRHPRVIHDFWRYSQGMVDDTLMLKYPHFSEIRLPIPDISAQAKIAKALSAQRRHIEVLEKLVEKHRERKRALMQQLLTGKKRLIDEAPKREGPLS